MSGVPLVFSNQKDFDLLRDLEGKKPAIIYQKIVIGQLKEPSVNSCLLHGWHKLDRHLFTFPNIYISLTHPLSIQIKPHQKVFYWLVSKIGDPNCDLKRLSFLYQLIAEVYLLYA